MVKQSPTAQDRARLGQAASDLAAGRLDAAEAGARALLLAYPGEAVVLNLLGGVAMKRGDHAGAADHLRAAAKAAPGDAMIAFNLGEALRQAGQAQDAALHFARARKLRPDFLEADARRGEALRALGDSDGARDAYQAVLAVNPAHPLARNGVGLLALQAGDGADAATHFRVALQSANLGEQAALCANLGLALAQTGQTPAAIEALLDAIERAPRADQYKRALARTLRNVKDCPASPRLRAALLNLFQRRDVNPRSLATAALAVLRAAHGTSQALFDDPLFLTLLARAPIPDVDVELLLAARRRALLGAVAAGETPPLEFVCALAQQCYLNEYVYLVSADEAAQLTAIATRRDWHGAAITGAYRALLETPFADLDAKGAPGPVAALLRMQVEEPRRERMLAAAIETLAPVADDVSRAVQAQYEENPFPRWTQCDLGTPLPLADALRAALPHARAEDAPKTDAPRVLIAGCGTGLQTMHAVGAYKNASILAIDLSRASLAYGMRKLEEYGVANVRCMRADILDLARLEDRFDVIESFGVIHHMAEPARGLAVLSGLLAPGGLLFLGLYSAIGRAAVVAARDWIAARGYPATLEGLRQARADIMAAPPAEMAALLSPASDFWTSSDCRDLIFHVHEHRFTLLEIEAMLAANDLEFLGLQIPNAADRAAFAAERGDLRSLPAWHAFETAHPHAFGETYRIWARKA